MVGEADEAGVVLGAGLDLADLEVCRRAAALAGMPLEQWIGVAAVAMARRLERDARGGGGEA